jgi:ArsR family transcriptional regulator
VIIKRLFILSKERCGDREDCLIRFINIDNYQYVMKESIQLLKNMSDETRFKILEFLLDGEKCVCKIFPHVKRTQSTVSIHLGNLEDAGVLESRRESKKIFYRIVDKRIYDVFKALGNNKGKILKRTCCCKK